MKCDLCVSEATCSCTWGLYKREDTMNEAKLCKEHLDELWKKIHGAVNAGFMHFVVKPL